MMKIVSIWLVIRPLLRYEVNPFNVPKLDFAVLPMGDNFTMGIEEAVMASSFIECKNIGCHYDTFPIIEMDQNKAKTAFESKGIHIHLPKIGETINM